jgi:cobalt-zinc-cadmium efflux system protein
MSFIIILVILWGTWRLFTDSIDLALDAVPKNINLEKVRELLLVQKGVEEIHDLHIWAMSTTQIALTAHLIMPKGFSDEFISELQEKLEHEFGIGHTTFQIENERIEKECKTDC